MSTTYKGHEIDVLKSDRVGMYFASIDNQYSKRYFDLPSEAREWAQYLIDGEITISDALEASQYTERCQMIEEHGRLTFGKRSRTGGGNDEALDT
jgi:hypothetical protein